MIRAVGAGGALIVAGVALLAVPAASSPTGPLSDKDRAMAAYVAAMSALAEHCGLDWEQRVFLRYTDILRREGRSEDAVAKFSALHGARMIVARQNLAEPCTPQTKAELNGLLQDGR